VGYVQVKRTKDMCDVKAKVVPEHRIHTKLYNVRVKINETDNIIIESACEDCAASEGLFYEKLL
jgi:hypothetical protein